MLRAQLCAVLGFVMLAAASAESGEVLFSVENRIGGDSNIFRRSRDEVDDGFYELAPRVIVREQGKELDFDLRYMPVYQTFFKTGSIDGWDHTGRGEITWHATPVDTFGVLQTFSDTRQLRLAVEDGVNQTVIEQESDRERARRFNTAAYYARQFSPTLGARFGLNFEDVDFNSERNTDTRSLGGSVGMNYALDPRATLGLSGSARYRQNRGVGRQVSSDSTIGNIAGSVAYRFSETLDVFVQAGPSFIRSKEDDIEGSTVPLFTFRGNAANPEAQAFDFPSGICSFQGQDIRDACPFIGFTNAPPPNFDQSQFFPAPANGRGDTTTDVTFFAQADLTKRWRLASLHLSYSRSESANAGSGSSSIVDAVSATLALPPMMNWTFSLFAQWSQREVVSDVRRAAVLVGGTDPLTEAPGEPPGVYFFAQAQGLTAVVIEDSSDFQIQQWVAIARVERRITDSWVLLSRLAYTSYEQDDSIRSSQTEAFEGFVGIRYEFEPIGF